MRGGFREFMSMNLGPTRAEYGLHGVKIVPNVPTICGAFAFPFFQYLGMRTPATVALPWTWARTVSKFKILASTPDIPWFGKAQNPDDFQSEAVTKTILIGKFTQVALIYYLK